MRTAHRVGSFAATGFAPGAVKVGMVSVAVLAGCVLVGIGGCGAAAERSATKAIVRAVERLGGRATVAPAGPDDGRGEGITRIDLAHTLVADDDIVWLAELSRDAAGPLAALEVVDLTHTAVGDRTVAVLATFPALRKLSLTLTRVTDAGLASLARLERLADLSLAETSLTDDAVAVLERCGSLRMLVLLRTGVSDAGVARLRKALPEAKIMIEPPGARRRQRSPRP